MNASLAYEIADLIEGTDAAAILLGLPYRSFCAGSDSLVDNGVWEDDGAVTEIGHIVKSILHLRLVSKD